MILSERLASAAGIILFLALCYAFSSDRKAINFKIVFWGLALQFVVAVTVLRGEWLAGAVKAFYPVPYYWNLLITLALIGVWFALKSPKVRSAYGTFLACWIVFLLLRHDVIARFFSQSRVVAEKVLGYSVAGGSFVFGVLGDNVAPPNGVGIVFAFYVLPTIIFVASFFSILYYYGIMQKIVKVVAALMARFMGTSGAESTSVAASIFMGQTEAPLTIKPLLSKLTNSELATVMTSGFAHVSAGIMVAYAAVVGRMDMVGNLLTCVIMTAPGAILISKMLYPESGKPITAGTDVKVEVPREEVNVIDAIARGASDGGRLALNVAGMLIAFIALIALINGIIGYCHDGIGMLAASHGGFFAFLNVHFPSTLQDVFGAIFSYVAWAIGVPWKDLHLVGGLIGTKVVVNEFVAFTDLAKIKDMLDPRSFVLVTYALCGFGNLSSIAIQVGGIGGMVPERRHDLAKLGMRTMLAGTLANLMAAAIVGLLM